MKPAVAVACATGLLALHVALGLIVCGQPGSLGIDRGAYDLLRPLRDPTGRDVIGVLTDLGGFPIALLVAVAGAVYANRHGRTGQALSLALGMLVLLVLVGLTKELWDRPRPVDALTRTRGQSFPSGHSAYATVWLAAAAVTGRRALISAGAVVLVTVMVSRLYLHVHYLTDVVGGAALGAAVFASVPVRR